MKVKGWDIGLLFLILLVTTVGIRVYYIMYMLADYPDMGTYLDATYQTATVILLFWFIYYMTKKYYCFRLSMILAVFPSYIHRISTSGRYNLVVLLMSSMIMVILSIWKIVERKEEENIMPASEVMTDSIMKEVKFLDNPLPVPKRREHKEMDFAIELTPYNDFFDINDIPEDDDFDIQ